jgi:hypothetical protein
MSRFTRILALSLPFAVAAVLACTLGGWRVHDGQIQRVDQVSEPVAQVPAPTRSQPQPQPQAGSGTVTEATFVRQLSPSVPWEVWAGLLLLCVLPAVGSVMAWSGSRRTQDQLRAGSGSGL